jgi:hypothetical protein
MKKPLTSLLIGIVTIFVGFFLYHHFECSPERAFPSGRTPAYALCYFMILVGIAYAYAGCIQLRWFSGSSLGLSFLTALGLSMLALIPISWVFGKHLGTIGIVLAVFVVRLPDPWGRLILFPLMAIFVCFAVLSWWGFFKQLLRPNKSGVNNRRTLHSGKRDLQ